MFGVIIGQYVVKPYLVPNKVHYLFLIGWVLIVTITISVYLYLRPDIEQVYILCLVMFFFANIAIGTLLPIAVPVVRSFFNKIE